MHKKVLPSKKIIFPFVVFKYSAHSTYSAIQIFKMRYLFFLSFFIISNYAFAQRPEGGRGGQGEQSPIGIVSGSVLDKTTKQGVEYASVTLVRARNGQIAAGGLTDAKGKFVIEQVPFGKFVLRVNFIGYQNFEKTDTIIVRPPNNIAVDAGEIVISNSTVALSEATVTAERAQFMNTIDKKVFVVGKDIISTGGSASDVLQNVPSVSVDLDGNVALRGSGNITILIDGKPSALMGTSKADVLRQLPSNNIESIELITNPSAKYDPEGVSGIINIVLKKNKQKGFNGSVAGGIGTGDKYNAALSLNYRTPKFNIFSNYGFRNDHRWGKGLLERHSTRTFSDAFTLSQNANKPLILNDSLGSENNSTTINIGHNARAGVDFYLNKTNTLGVAAGFNLGEKAQNEQNEYKEYRQSGELTNRYARSNINASQTFAYDGNINFKHQFAKPKQELTADVSYSNNDSRSIGNFGDNTSFIDSVYYNKIVPYDTATNHAYFGDKLQNTGTKNDVLTVQADYTEFLKNGARLETGYKATKRSIETDLKYFNSATENAAFLNTGRSNNFVYNELINAVYATYANSFKEKWGYQAGLRLEQTDIAGNLKTTNKTFNSGYFSAFPSGNISYKATKTDELRLSFSRRIRRPNNEEVNPFPDYENITVLRFGNPALKPEYTNAYELAYLKNWKKHSVSTTGYFRATENQIQRYPTLKDGVTQVAFINLDFRNNYGVEAIVKNEFTKWWNATTTLNTFYTELNTGSTNGNVARAGWGFSGRLQSNMILPKSFTVQITGNYNAPFVMPGGKFIGMQGADIGIRKDFLGGLLNTSLSLSDVFDTQRFEVFIDNKTFGQHALRKRETRILTLGATLRFGNMKADSKRPRREERNEQMPEGGGGF
jgi:iron complex outermembrane recepter protein